MNRTIFQTGCKLLCAAVLLGGLSACASSADPAAMTITTSAQPGATTTPFPAKFEHGMCVRNVTGGEETNPLWVSKVDDAGFRTALSSSMDNAGLTGSGDACHFPVDVNLLGLSQPAVGFDMTVTSHVNYKVFDLAGQPVLLATIDAPYTAEFSEAFAAVERLKKANEGSIRTSIQQFFDKLHSADVK